MDSILLREAAAWSGARVGVPGEAARTVAERLPGEWENIELTQVSRDTHTVGPGALFVALKGSRRDGHDFIGEAARLGAAAALCGRGELRAPIPLLYVPDTLRAVQQIAAGYRARLRLRVVGVTGSVGKTTTCIMIGRILERRLRVMKTDENMNGQIGLPFGLFRMDHTHEAAVLEMGMSQYGELLRLTKMARPDIAVINTIGTAHIEFFGSRENILKAKLEILEGLQPGGAAVLNGDEPLLWRLRGALGCRTVFFGLDNPDSEVRGTVLSEEAGSVRFRIAAYGNVFDVRLPAVGLHNVRNALAAAAVAFQCGLGPAEIAAGLGAFESASGRQRIYDRKGYTIIEDCYNASPDSMRAALGVLARLPVAGRRLAVLGGMRELGEYAAQAHRECGACAAACADRLFLFGEGCEQYAEGARTAGMPAGSVMCFDDRSEMAETLRAFAKPGDGLLFKGSRLMKMEEVLEKFLEAGD